MVNMQMIFKAVDEMTTEQINELKGYLEEKQRVVKWAIIRPEDLQEFKEIMRPMREDAVNMTEAEVNAVIDEAIAEVRRERKQNQSGD